MPGSPYRTPPHGTAPPPIANHTDDSALPIVALAILLAALAPPLSFGVVSVWDALRSPSDAESRVEPPRSRRGMSQARRPAPRVSDL